VWHAKLNESLDIYFSYLGTGVVRDQGYIRREVRAYDKEDREDANISAPHISYEIVSASESTIHCAREWGNCMCRCVQKIFRSIQNKYMTKLHIVYIYMKGKSKVLQS
jgi:hypothetical protein